MVMAVSFVFHGTHETAVVPVLAVEAEVALMQGHFKSLGRCAVQNGNRL